MISILLNASIAGGIVILLWALSYPLSKKYFRASWHYAVLKIAMLFLIFPIGIFAPAFNNMLAGLFAKTELPRIPEQIQIANITPEAISSVNTALSNIVFPAVQYSPPLPKAENANVNAVETPDNVAVEDVDDIENNNTMPDIPYLQIIWLTVAIAMLSNEIRKMHRFKKQILKSSSVDVDRDISELFLQCKTQLKVRGRLTLRTSEYIRTPLAFGLISPIVIFPETDMSADEKRLAFIHELTHIKNGDLWLKALATIISAVHWFNPFTHLLRRKLSVIGEEYCDECVVRKMTKQERLLYGSLILKVVSDIAAPQIKYCSTLSASTKNIKRRLSNMLNSKKSRRSMIALSVIAAFILCSLASIYTFAANANEENALISDDIYSKNDETLGIDEEIIIEEVYPFTTNERFYNELKEMYNQLISEQEFTGTFEDFLNETANGLAKLKQMEEYANDNINPTEMLKNMGALKELNNAFRILFSGTLGIGFTDENGESTSRFSRDGGLTWFMTDENHENETLDPNISAIEYVTYDEYRAWIENKRADPNDEQLKDYESQLEDVKNGIGTAGKVIVGDREIIFVFYQAEQSHIASQSSIDTSSYVYYNGETFHTYSREEMDETIAAYQEYMSNQPSQEEIDEMTAMYQSMVINNNDSSITIISGEAYHTYSQAGETMVYAYRYIADDGEPMGFGADTYKHLYKLVKDHFNEQVEASKMTREEADSRLAELSEENTRTLINIDSEGNIID